VCVRVFIGERHHAVQKRVALGIFNDDDDDDVEGKTMPMNNEIVAERVRDGDLAECCSILFEFHHQAAL
jgi:hypothetical protein